MDYIFGTSTRTGKTLENLKTVGAEHTNLSGFISTVREFEDGSKIEDRCRIIKKYASKDTGGKCYDWYLIDSHYRVVDNSGRIDQKIMQLTANTDYIAMMAGVDIPDAESNVMTLTLDAQSPKFETVKNYFLQSLWNSEMLLNAVDRWITSAEYAEILGVVADVH